MLRVLTAHRTKGTGQVEGLLAEQIDHFYYLHDVLGAGVDQLSDIVVCWPLVLDGDHSFFTLLPI